MADPSAPHGHLSPFLEIDRSEWSALAPRTSTPLAQREIVELRGLGDELDLGEVEEVYLPLSRLLSLYVENTQRMHDQTTSFLGLEAGRTPFVIGVAGSVAGGKSTGARPLRERLTRWGSTPRVGLITTDGRCSSSSAASKRANVRSRHPSTHTWPTTSCPTPRSA